LRVRPPSHWLEVVFGVLDLPITVYTCYYEKSATTNIGIEAKRCGLNCLDANLAGQV
jgi:hypothetical protein